MALVGYPKKTHPDQRKRFPKPQWMNQRWPTREMYINMVPRIAWAGFKRHRLGHFQMSFLWGVGVSIGSQRKGNQWVKVVLKATQGKPPARGPEMNSRMLQFFKVPFMLSQRKTKENTPIFWMQTHMATIRRRHPYKSNIWKSALFLGLHSNVKQSVKRNGTSCLDRRSPQQASNANSPSIFAGFCRVAPGNTSSHMQ